MPFRGHRRRDQHRRLTTPQRWWRPWPGRCRPAGARYGRSARHRYSARPRSGGCRTRSTVGRLGIAGIAGVALAVVLPSCTVICLPDAGCGVEPRWAGTDRAGRRHWGCLPGSRTGPWSIQLAVKRLAVDRQLGLHRLVVRAPVVVGVGVIGQAAADRGAGDCRRCDRPPASSHRCRRSVLFAVARIGLVMADIEHCRRPARCSRSRRSARAPPNCSREL